MDAGMIGAIGGASVAVLTAAGGAMKFVWNKVEQRFTKIENALAECRIDRETSEKRRGILITIVELLKQELVRYLPESPTLSQVENKMAEFRYVAK